MPSTSSASTTPRLLPIGRARASASWRWTSASSVRPARGSTRARLTKAARRCPDPRSEVVTARISSSAVAASRSRPSAINASTPTRARSAKAGRKPVGTTRSRVPRWRPATAGSPSAIATDCDAVHLPNVVEQPEIDCALLDLVGGSARRHDRALGHVDKHLDPQGHAQRHVIARRARVGNGLADRVGR